MKRMTKRKTATPVALNAAQRDRLESLWFVYGNHGPKETYGNHQFIQGFLERGEGAPPPVHRADPGARAPDAGVRGRRGRRAPGRGAGGGLRLVKSLGARPQPQPDPELKAVLDDMKRRQPGRRVRIERGPDDIDAA